jgi:hypothetical protein
VTAPQDTKKHKTEVFHVKQHSTLVLSPRFIQHPLYRFIQKYTIAIIVFILLLLTSITGYTLYYFTGKEACERCKGEYLVRYNELTLVEGRRICPICIENRKR